MRKKGAEFEYREAYYKDLMRAYREALAMSDVGARQKDVVAIAVRLPASRFWVSETRAYKVVGQLMRSGEEREKVLGRMRQSARDMYEEIYRRVVRRMRRTGESRWDAVVAVCGEAAPRFYIGVGSFLVYKYRYEKEWFERRRKRLLHAGR